MSEGRKKIPFIRAFFRERKKKRGGRERERERKKELSHFLFFPSSVLLEYLRTPQKKRNGYRIVFAGRSFFTFPFLPLAR